MLDLPVYEPTKEPPKEELIWRKFPEASGENSQDLAFHEPRDAPAYAGWRSDPKNFIAAWGTRCDPSVRRQRGEVPWQMFVACLERQSGRRWASCNARPNCYRHLELQERHRLDVNCLGLRNSRGVLACRRSAGSDSASLVHGLVKDESDSASTS